MFKHKTNDKNVDDNKIGNLEKIDENEPNTFFVTIENFLPMMT